MVKAWGPPALLCFPLLLVEGGIKWPLIVKDILYKGRKERGIELILIYYIISNFFYNSLAFKSLIASVLRKRRAFESPLAL